MEEVIRQLAIQIGNLSIVNAQLQADLIEALERIKDMEKRDSE